MYYLIQCQWNQLHVATLHRFEGGKQHVGKLSQHYCWCTLPTAKIPISFPRLGVPGTGQTLPGDTRNLFQTLLTLLFHIHIKCTFPLWVKCKMLSQLLGVETTIKDDAFWCTLQNSPAVISCIGNESQHSQELTSALNCQRRIMPFPYCVNTYFLPNPAQSSSPAQSFPS